MRSGSGNWGAFTDAEHIAAQEEMRKLVLDLSTLVLALYEHVPYFSSDPVHEAREGSSAHKQDLAEHDLRGGRRTDGHAKRKRSSSPAPPGSSGSALYRHLEKREDGDEKRYQLVGIDALRHGNPGCIPLAGSGEDGEARLRVACTPITWRALTRSSTSPPTRRSRSARTSRSRRSTTTSSIR